MSVSKNLFRYANNYKKRYAQLTSDSLSKDISMTMEDAFVLKMRKVVEDRLDDPILAVVHDCRAANLSHMQVYRKLKALTGKSPPIFIRSIRLQKAHDLLRTTDLNVSEVAYDVGFSDPGYFSRSFLEEFGVRPSVVRK